MRLINYIPNDKNSFLLICFSALPFFGLISLCLGADTNWDLTNYHIYNPYALLNGKLHIDLAPAGLQTYFNPLLDVPYYLMTQYFPAPLIGFIMGAVHGINFALLAGISYKALPNLPSEDRYRIPLLLALFGCLTANFLSSIGNTMGDNSTSLFILASLLIILMRWEQLPKATWLVIFAGVIAGLGTGLKLTNAVYALAMCLSFFVVPSNWMSRLRLAFCFGIGVLIGMTLTSGYWFYEMWQTFGNPLFPQFSSYFPNPLARSTGVIDDVWRPKTLLESIAWPFIFSLNPKRVGQLEIHQIIWPVLTILFWYWVAIALIKKWRKKSSEVMPPSAQFILAFVVIGYVIWMKLFSIQRYLVPLEVCIPLLIFILMMQLTNYQRAKKLAIGLLLFTSAVVLFGGIKTWGHASWSEKMFHVEMPPIASPEKTTVILINGNPALGWMVPQFPVTVAFAQVRGNFPETTEYANKVHDIAVTRGGDVFAIIHEEKQTGRVDQIRRIRQVASSIGITSSEQGCSLLQWAALNLKLRMVVTPQNNSTENTACFIDVLPSDLIDVASKNKELREEAQKIVANYGFTLEENTCESYSAFMGQDERPYQWCRLIPIK
jgi:hypothetical protein